MPTPPVPRIAVGAVVTDPDGRLLVVERGNPPAQGRWTLPGGRQQAGERVEEAVVREVEEETGLRVRVGALVGHLEFVDDDHHYVILDFRAEVEGGTLRADDDVTDVAWCTRRELEQLPTTRGLLDFLDQHGIEVAG